MNRLDLLDSHAADVAELAERLDHAGDSDGFARALASFIELAGGSIPVMVDGTELVVRTTAGPYHLTITREGSDALPRVA